MSADRPAPYEPPVITDRTPIDFPLIGAIGSGEVAPSAVFR